jgi:hypothetical protein
MDIYCSHCGEPWDNDSLHDEAEASGRSYTEVARNFRIDGCPALAVAYGASCSTPSTSTDRTFGLTRQEASAALYDLLGDDMDGAAAMMEDMGF